MIEEIVSFETAKMAKDKGFRETTETFYSSAKKGSSVYCDEVNAPTQSLLALWLRETHGCYIYIVPEPYSTGINFNWQVLFYDSTSITGWSDKSTGLYGDNGEYKTFEAALEAALQKALELIQQTNP